MAGLKPNELKALQRLTNRRYDVHSGYTLEQAKELGALSRLISRQIGLLIDRQGKVELTIVGDAHGILIPTLARERSTGRLRGIRLLHTHLTDSKLSGEDLMDLLFLRLDSIGVLTIDEFGAPIHFLICSLPLFLMEAISATSAKHPKNKSSWNIRKKSKTSPYRQKILILF